MPEKPARKEPERYYGEEYMNENGTPSGHYEYDDDNPRWRYDGASVLFKDYGVACAAWDSFSDAWDKCQKNAEMIAFCQQVEYETGLQYGMLVNIEESYSFTMDSLTRAMEETQNDDERHIKDMNVEIGILKSTMAREKTIYVDNKISDLNDINKNLDNIGHGLTTYHRKLYSDYKRCCSVVGEPIQTFYSEAED